MEVVVGGKRTRGGSKDVIHEIGSWARPNVPTWSKKFRQSRLETDHAGPRHRLSPDPTARTGPTISDLTRAPSEPGKAANRQPRSTSGNVWMSTCTEDREREVKREDHQGRRSEAETRTRPKGRTQPTASLISTIEIAKRDWRETSGVLDRPGSWPPSAPGESPGPSEHSPFRQPVPWETDAQGKERATGGRDTPGEERRTADSLRSCPPGWSDAQPDHSENSSHGAGNKKVSGSISSMVFRGDGRAAAGEPMRDRPDGGGVRIPRSIEHVAASRWLVLLSVGWYRSRSDTSSPSLAQRSNRNANRFRAVCKYPGGERRKSKRPEGLSKPEANDGYKRADWRPPCGSHPGQGTPSGTRTTRSNH